MVKFFVIFVVVVFLVVLVFVSDVDFINDYCVVDLVSKVIINGLVCKVVLFVMLEDFVFRGFCKDGDINNFFGIVFVLGFVGINYFGLNIFGFVLVKFNYVKGGFVFFYIYFRVVEVIYVVKGEVYVGFVDIVGKFFVMSLKRGDFFVFFKGLVYF